MAGPPIDLGDGESGSIISHFVSVSEVPSGDSVVALGEQISMAVDICPCRLSTLKIGRLKYVGQSPIR